MEHVTLDGNICSNSDLKYIHIKTGTWYLKTPGGEWTVFQLVHVVPGPETTHFLNLRSLTVS